MDRRLTRHRPTPATPRGTLAAIVLVATLFAALLAAAKAPAHEGEEHAGWDVRITSAPTETGVVDPLRFEVRDAKGKPLTGYQATHDRLLHAWLVRTDSKGRTSGYQHVHPVLDGDEWVVNDAQFNAPGTWNLVVDTTANGVQGFGFAAFEVSGPAVPDTPASAHGHVARIVSIDEQADGTAKIRVRISDEDGAPVTDVREHIGAAAHWSSFVARADGIRGAAHAHAMTGVDSDGVIEFDVAPPKDYALADATGGWIELRTASHGVCVMPLRPSGVGSRPGDGIMLRLRTLASEAGAIVGTPVTGDGAPTGHDMSSMPGMDHGSMAGMDHGSN